jgi:hypothetical protein
MRAAHRGGGSAMADEADFFRRRALEERLAARGAQDSRVRLQHLELAKAYQLRVRELTGQEKRSSIWL